MIQETNNSTCQYPSTLDELIIDMESHPDKYKHLQIILNHNRNKLGLGLGQKYMVVSSDSFAVYQLLNLDYSNGVIQLILKENVTDEIVCATVNINDKYPRYLLICWNDIKKMVYAEKTYNDNNDEILELDE